MKRTADLKKLDQNASCILSWLCIAADIALVWFLNMWNLLGWRF